MAYISGESGYQFVYFKDSFNWYIKFICTYYESVKIPKDNKNFELKYHIVVKNKDTKRAIRAYKLKEDRQYNGQKKGKNDKQRSPNHAQKTTNPTKKKG